MQPRPTVSVVLPVWNGERFLGEAVESVLSQTLDSIELLLVDDGSTDATPEIARDFARRDERVGIIRLSRSGIARALNAGIARARGRYVARMDADDVADPSRLQKQTEFLDANSECVAVGTAVDVIDEAGELVGTRTFPEHHADIVQSMVRGCANAIAHPTAMTRREALLSVGGYRPDRTPTEDLDLWLRLSRIGKLANLSDRLLRYRRHTDSVGARERDTQFQMGQATVNEARRMEGLDPLRLPLRSTGRSRAANYHADCARTALLTGPRAAAIKHARASIAAEPSWPEAYIALVACVFPRWTLRCVRSLSLRLRPLLF